ncbi:aluminum-activated malate transporter 1-like [Phragmites australis]|uniref:aluminum-activated malate transporter 1-like n=1 Tax=Phragmites australis TaxID=29695 RepID=UPI002D770AE5|nr:aluminum-activated malate transporter 1-like [Phragmites australis]
MEVQMETNIHGGGDGNGSFMARCRQPLCSALDRLRSSGVGFAGKLAKIARDDPRRVAHSVKVGLALTLVSVLYYVTPLFNGFGVSTLWAVLTVVVVMEYTVGGTLSKGLNRAFATLVAGFIAVGAHQVANRCGEKGEPILLAVFVFLLASAATFSRFIPEVKARYDYGVTIFILTFSLVAVSSYRVEDLTKLAHQRFSTIVVGVFICLCTTIFVFPVWAGEDLHKLAAGNLDKLAEFLEGIESECFGENAASENLENKAFLQVYKSVLNSKASEDSLCNFAKWEPGHGKFSFRHPWSQYQKLGALCRQCASSMEALASYVTTLTKSQYPEANPELCLKVRTTCGEMSSHSAKALSELSSAIRTMTIPSPTNNHMSAAIKAANSLRSELSEDEDLLQVMHVAVIASLLSDLVTQIKKITESVDNLARLACFKNPEKTQKDVIIGIKS